MVTLEALPPAPPMGVDYRDEVPDIRLFPDERVYPKPYKVNIPTSRFLTPEEALCALTGVSRLRDVGKVRPSKAALSGGAKELQLFSTDGTLFGRDSLIIAEDVFPIAPLLQRITLLELAKEQGIAEVVNREEEPGKILHELRRPDDPIALAITRDAGWGWPYYGSADSTPEWIKGMNNYCMESEEGPEFLRAKFTGRDNREHTMADAYAGALEWILGKTKNGETVRLLEYRQSFPGSLANQNWTDSIDAAHHANGKLADPRFGIATVDVQALAYDALVGAADLYEKGEGIKINYPQLRVVHPDDLRQRAADLKKLTIGLLWKGDHFALGYERDAIDNLLVMDIWRSNMGHLLNSGMLDDEPEIRGKTAWALFSPQMVSDLGIRTLAKGQARFRPGSYHNGSEWLQDIERIAKGLRRHGLYGLSGWLRTGNQITCEKFQRYPEFRRGDDGELNDRVVTIWDDKYGRPYTAEQPPQQQGWVISAVIAANYDFKQDLTRVREGLPFVRDDETRLLDKQILETLPQRPAA